MVIVKWKVHKHPAWSWECLPVVGMCFDHVGHMWPWWNEVDFSSGMGMNM